MGTFVFKPWRVQINQASWIFHALSNSSSKHTLAHMLLYTLTPKLFWNFCMQSFEGEWPLHSPFIRNFWIEHFLANHINTFCTTSTPFLIMIGLKNTFNPKNPSWKIAILMAIFLELFLNFLFTKGYFSWTIYEFSVHKTSYNSWLNMGITDGILLYFEKVEERPVSQCL